ncbi:MAG: polysaccharide pyruvyl transferase family protein [Planctomycetes bacterium]|nr:polysaccharide pyruvyl transferase family protein [Planctomycetota bacterium]
MIAPTKIRKVCLFGASPDTGNRGVTALCHSVLWNLHSHAVDDVTVFDHGRGARPDAVNFGDEQVQLTRRGAVNSRRFHRGENLWNIRLATWLSPKLSSAACDIANADAVYDVSAGDSFTDLYGDHRFWTVALPKLIALEAGTPLILLPQTYGPFKSEHNRDVASQIARKACMAWSRDTDGYQALQDLLGSDFDPVRHRSGVDMAFALPPIRPAQLPENIEAWLQPEARKQAPLVGFNVNGLIYNTAQAGAEQFGLTADYPRVVHDFLTWLLQTTDSRVVIVPHVTAPQGHPESDFEAATRAVARLGDLARERVLIVPQTYTPSEYKWLIGQTDWFCGTRMHTTIAALGSGVPTASVSYSLKTRGVYASCGQEKQVFELRHTDTEQIVSSLQQSYSDRDVTRRNLAAQVPAVVARAKEQLDEILAFVATGNKA